MAIGITLNHERHRERLSHDSPKLKRILYLLDTALKEQSRPWNVAIYNTTYLMKIAG